jgi:PTS system glucose-specific IIA component
VPREETLEFKNHIAIPSPVNGRVMQLEQFPSPMVQQRLLGDGVCIMAAGYQLYSPFDGIVETLPPTGHLIRLKSQKGLKLNMMLGWHSETLMGEGFRLKKKVGEPVMQGELIMEFDLPKLKRISDPALFAITLLNSDKIKGMTTQYQQVLANQDTLFELFF